VKPCSFANEKAHTFNLRNISFQYIWEKKYQAYRNSVINNCKRACRNKDQCRGACVYFDEINYCYSNNQEEALHV